MKNNILFLARVRGSDHAVSPCRLIEAKKKAGAVNCMHRIGGDCASFYAAGRAVWFCTDSPSILWLDTGNCSNLCKFCRTAQTLVLPES